MDWMSAPVTLTRRLRLNQCKSEPAHGSKPRESWSSPQAEELKAAAIKAREESPQQVPRRAKTDSLLFAVYDFIYVVTFMGLGWVPADRKFPRTS